MRNRGAQPGHPPHQRPPVEVSEVDEVLEYALPRCPDGGGPVDPSAERPRFVPQVEIIERPIRVTEHRGLPCPTNNLAEQAIRFVVLDRIVTQGSRGETGQRWLERIWTTVATGVQQGRRVFAFLEESITAHFTDQPPPRLVANTS